MTEIYVKLLNEGTVVFRPTQGISMGNNKYTLLPAKDYDEEDEDWEFKPGTIVIAEKRIIEGKESLLAVSKG